jgi:ACR3 family arsenite efflux pump ArsB
MNPFEYVTVIVSIIVGLSIARLLTGAVSVMRVDTPTKPRLLHSIWIGALLLQNVYLWSLRWSGSTRNDWSYGLVVMFLVTPIIYYALAELLFPARGDEVDLNEYFLDNRRAFFGLIILSHVAAAASPFLFYDGFHPAGTDLTRNVVMIPIMGLLAWTRNEKAHLLWAVLHLLTLVTTGGAVRIG